MRGGPLSLLLVLLCMSCIRAGMEVQPGFDLQQFTGMWYVSGVVSNCSTFQSMKGVMKTAAAKVGALPDGDMTILTGYPMGEECQKVEMLFKKTDQPGHFTSEESDAKRDLWVLATDYIRFAIVLTLRVANGERDITVQLYVRHLGVTPEVQENFKEHSHKLGLTDDMMVILPKSDVCFKLLSG